MTVTAISPVDLPDEDHGDGCDCAEDYRRVNGHYPPTSPEATGLSRQFIAAGTGWGRHSDAVRVNGWTVVNAPRPLPGLAAWEGPFRCGVFYAAGPLDQFQAAWRDSDATILEPVTPDEVVSRIAAYCTKDGYDLHALFYDDPEIVANIAAELGLPWNHAWMEPDQ